MNQTPQIIVILAAITTTHAAFGDEPADVLSLTGTARDFRERTATNGHPDFEREPLFGFGHYAGNIALTLGTDGRPVFVGGGHKVGQTFRDALGRPIAPHLANARWATAGEGGGGGGATEPGTTSAVLEDSKGRDAYEIEFLGVTMNPDGTSSWSYRISEIPGKGQDLSHWNVKLDPAHEVMPGTTAGYDHGTDGSTGFFGIKWDVGDSFESGSFTIVLDGHYQGVDDPAGVLAKGGNKADTAEMFVPGTGLAQQGGSEGGETGTPVIVADPSLGDTVGRLDMEDDGAIESAASFAQWYRDIPGVNLSTAITLDFERQPDGMYVFDDELDCHYSGIGGFFPIDDQCFGNSAGSPDHNFHFTFELHTEFTYDADANQIFTFAGDDDVWVFVDGKLAIDIGGVHPELEQTVQIDRMGLEDGGTYALDFFFAERHRTQSNFRITTNIELRESTRRPTLSAAFD